MIEKIKRLLYWIPILWGLTCDCCYYSLLEIMRAFLIRQADIHEEEDHFTDSQQQVKRMRYAVMLLNRMIEDDYHESGWRRHRLKWGEGKFVFYPIEGEEEMARLEIEYPNVITEEDKKQENIDSYYAMKRTMYLERQDYEQLFELLKKYIRGWWI